MSAAKRIAVMEGELEGIDLVEVLQVVGIGRQYTGVELRKADNTTLGTLFIKAGKVVTAVAGPARGREAFFQLFQQVTGEARKFFHVFRMDTPSELPEPIGSLGSLVLEALTRAKNGTAPVKAGSGFVPKLSAVPAQEETKTVPSADAAQGQGVARPSPPSSRRRSSSTSMPAVTAGSPSIEGHSAVPEARRSGSHEIVARQGSHSAGAAAPAAAGATSADSKGSSTQEHGPGERPRIVLGVVSPKGGSGKTTIALNLALSFARQDRSVILVDADLNGDVLSAISARERAAHGAIDVLLERLGYEAALLKTVLPHFRILPARGELPDTVALFGDHGRAWQRLLRRLSDEAEIVIIDGPAGMFGATRQFMTSCTHVLGVLQAELIASRSFGMLERSLALIPEAERPEVVGVVLNMLQARHRSSVRVLQDACTLLPKGWLLDTAIPRSDAFLDATEEGLPLRLLDERNPPAVSWLFDTLAAEITERLGLPVAERKPRPLLV